MRYPIGEMLIARKLVTAEQVDRALAQQKRTGQRLGHVLLDLRMVEAADLRAALAEQFGVPATRVDAETVDRDAVKLVPERLARRCEAIVLARNENRLTIAIADPRNLGALDDLRFATGLEIEVMVALERDIGSGIDRFYRDELPTALSDPADPLTIEDPTSLAFERDLDDDQAAIRLVDQILTHGIADRASDVHLEPQESGLRVRLRVDGLLNELVRLPERLHPAVIARVKVLAGMDIAEHRLPQDGRFTATVGSRKLDIRVGGYPTVWGEKLVLRLLDRESLRVVLESVGMPDDLQATWRELIRRPEGMLLVTGPTGSGKTSTLYASLVDLIDSGRNIVTIENPVEYELDGINQGQTNDRAGFTFASGLRAILRQDPDVILVGEIRDSETLGVAVEAALTGHLVLATLHTGSAASSVTRLVEMGVERYLLCSTLLAVLAQRLVRTVCDRCASPVPLLEELAALLPAPAPASVVRGAGCVECRGTGYRGRTGIFEMLPITDEVRRLILRQAPETDLERAGQFRSLRDEGLRLALAGTTTIEEVLRVTQLRS